MLNSKSLSLRVRKQIGLPELLLLAGAGVALILRLYGLGNQGLWFDEAYSVFIANLPLPFSLEVLIADGVHPPLYYLIQRAVLPLGQSEAAVRLPASLAGIFSVPLVFVLGKDWSGRSVGLIAALLLVVSPLHIWYSQEARMYSALMALSVACMFAYYRFLQSRSWSGDLLLVLASAAAYFTHYFALFLPLVQFAHIGVNFRVYHRHLAKWVALQLVASIPLLLWLFAISRQEQVILGIGWIETPQIVDLALTMINFSVGFVQSGDPIRWLAALLFLGLAVRGIRTPWKAEGVGSLVILWGALPIALTFLLSLRRPSYVDRFLILSLPALLLMVANGIGSLSRGWMLTTGGAILAFSIYGIATFNFGPQQQKESWREASAHLSRAAPDEATVVRTLQMVVPLAHYHPDYRSFDVIEVNRELTPISRYAEGTSGLWLLYWHPSTDAHGVAANAPLNPSAEKDPLVAKWITGRGPPILEQLDLNGLTLFHFGSPTGSALQNGPS